MAEIHTRDTDIAYVLQGSATLVTGGMAVGVEGDRRPRSCVAPPSRAARLASSSRGRRGGHPQRHAALVQGSEAPFLYYVVKVTAGGAGPRPRPSGAHVMRPRPSLVSACGAGSSPCSPCRRAPTHGQATVDLPVGAPAATVVDLRTPKARRWSRPGGATATSRWSRSTIMRRTRICGLRARPTGPTTSAPTPGAADFDDSAWETLEPAELEARRSNGRLAFNWYRTGSRCPDTVGGFDVTGVDRRLRAGRRRLRRDLGGRPAPAGAGPDRRPAHQGLQRAQPRRADRDARPGQQIQLAVFGSTDRSPGRRRTSSGSARRRSTSIAGPGGRRPPLRPRSSGSIPHSTGSCPGTRRSRSWRAGSSSSRGRSGIPTAICCSVIPTPTPSIAGRRSGAVSVFRSKSGYTGVDIGEYHQPGSNGLTSTGTACSRSTSTATGG